MILTVEGVSRSYRSKHCKGKIYVKELKLNMFNHLCVRNERVRSSLEVGDSIKVYGSFSVFGFNYNWIEKNNKN